MRRRLLAAGCAVAVTAGLLGCSSSDPAPAATDGTPVDLLTHRGLTYALDAAGVLHRREAPAADGSRTVTITLDPGPQQVVLPETVEP